MTMSSVAHSSTAPEIRAIERLGANVRIHLRLVQTGDGWALTADDGQVVFEAPGTSGRRNCLEFARTRGVLAIRS